MNQSIRLKEMENVQLKHAVNMSQQDVDLLRQSQRTEVEKSHQVIIEVERLKSHIQFLAQDNELLQKQVSGLSSQLSATTSGTVDKSSCDDMKQKYDS